MREKIKNMSTEELLRLKKLLEAKNVRRGGNQGTSTAKEQAEPQEFILYMLHDPMAFLPEHFSTAWIDQTNGIQGIFGRLREDPENSVPQALLFMKANNWDLAKMQDWLQNHPQYLRASAPAQPGIQPASGDTGVMKMGKEKRPQTLEGRVTLLETLQRLKEQDAELTEKEIKQKIAELNQQKADLDAKLYPEAELSEEERTAIKTQIDVLYAEIQAYEQALAALMAGTAVSPRGGSTEEINEFRERLKKYPVYIQESYLDLLNDRRPLSELDKLLEAEWDTEYINDLPDSAFAYIEPGGEKDEQEKTTPRSLRHLPFKNAQGNIDHDHLVNALARLPQTTDDVAKTAAKKKLCSAVKTWNSEHEDKIESDVCGTATEQQGNQEPEKDEHGCKIGEERYDEEQDKCVPITAEARIAFLETSLKLKEQEELTVDEIKQKIADLTKQKEDLGNKLYPESPLSEEEKTAIQAQIESLYAEIQAYEQALASKITGQAAEKKKGLGEAIIAPGTPEQPSDLISRKEVLALIPDRRVWRSWSYGPQMLVKQLKHKLEEKSDG